MPDVFDQVNPPSTSTPNSLEAAAGAEPKPRDIFDELNSPAAVHDIFEQVNPPKSQTPEADKAMAETSPMSELLRGADLKSIPFDVIKSLSPFTESPRAIKQAWDVLHGVPIEQAIPESQTLVGIEKKPLEQRITTGLNEVINLAFAKGAAEGVLGKGGDLIAKGKEGEKPAPSALPTEQGKPALGQPEGKIDERAAPGVSEDTQATLVGTGEFARVEPQAEEVIPSEKEKDVVPPEGAGEEQARQLLGQRADVLALAGEQLPPPLKVAESVEATSKTTDTPKEAAPPTLDESNGGMKPPPPKSLYSPDTPPESDPHQAYLGRVSKAISGWWEKFWPRSLAVTQKAPDSNVISEHQRILASDMGYLQDFVSQPFWKEFRHRPEQEIINLEDAAVKLYRRHLENKVEPKQAYEAVLNQLPKDVADLMRWRDKRVEVEKAAAAELGVDAPTYTGDPYLARLTNEEGKAIVDLHPSISNLGRQIRTTIGSFDNSRVHLTMKDGIAKDTQYEPVRKSVLLRELTSARLESTANMLRNLKGKVLFDTKEEALAASPTKQVIKVRGFGGNEYYARTREEGIFLEQNLNTGNRGSALGRLVQLANTYVRNPSLVNPLPHTTKNMFFKYMLARVGNATFRRDVADFAAASKASLRGRFENVMPMTDSAQRIPQLLAKEVGNWAEKAMSSGLKINNPSTKFIFAQADPAMRFALWKSYIRKGMGDQEAANHVWLDLVRYDENSGGISFWKGIPLNFFVPWRLGTYVTLAKQFRAHPVRSLLFVGAVEYLREMRYRQTGRWTHLPVDYIDAPLAEAIKSPKTAPAVAATTLLFGPGGGQAPSTIKDIMETLSGDPQQRARLMNMFWGLSQLYELPREWTAYQRDGDNKHLVNLVTTAALSEHSALKYEPRRLMQWLPDWMPGMQKSELVLQAEALRGRIESKREKGQLTYEARHGVSRTFQYTPEEQQLEELSRSAGIGGGRLRPALKR